MSSHPSLITRSVPVVLNILESSHFCMPAKMMSRFEKHDDFFASFFSKKNEERNNASGTTKG